MIENGKWIEKREDMRDFSFSYLCLVGEPEKLRNEKKKFWLIKKKNERIENIVCINLLSCSYGIKKKYFYLKKCV